MHRFQFPLAAAVAVLLAPAATQAEELAVPTGEVLLTITGAIGATNDGDTAIFDRAMLEALETVTFETTTIWTEGLHSFTGVPLSVLMEAVEAEGTTLSATAINDYSVDFPAEDWVEDGPIVAYLNNGEEMSLRDKGPLWIVYPYDSKIEYRAEVIYSRSIWQLERIAVED